MIPQPAGLHYGGLSSWTTFKFQGGGKGKQPQTSCRTAQMRQFFGIPSSLNDFILIRSMEDNGRVMKVSAKRAGASADPNLGEMGRGMPTSWPRREGEMQTAVACPIVKASSSHGTNVHCPFHVLRLPTTPPRSFPSRTRQFNLSALRFHLDISLTRSDNSFCRYESMSYWTFLFVFVVDHRLDVAPRAWVNFHFSNIFKTTIHNLGLKPIETCKLSFIFMT